ncbi:MAG: DUF4268 domain-containing protein [Thermoleophilia bacterium]
MKGKIYLIQQDNVLQALSEEPYGNEDLLQKLLENYPDLLAGDQINESAPRRWLLVSREMGVPGEEGGSNVWSLDHLFLDQDAVPTLVEVKRSTDTRIRREVVGQMLDYAANAVVYWPVESIRSVFESTCERAGTDPDEQVLDLIGSDGENNDAIEDYWKQVKTNLQAARIRLVFLADAIPSELKRIVEFLNSVTDPTEVLAIELRQFVGEGIKTLVPRVIGQTAEAQQKKGGGSRVISSRGEAYRTYFQKLVDDLRDNYQFTNAKVAQAQAWHGFASGIAGVSLLASFARGDRARVDLYVDQKDKSLFDYLKDHKREIEEELGEALEWSRIDDKRASRILIYIPSSIDTSEEQLQETHAWHVKQLLKFKEVFVPWVEKRPDGQ